MDGIISGEATVGEREEVRYGHGDNGDGGCGCEDCGKRASDRLEELLGLLLLPVAAAAARWALLLTPGGLALAVTILTGLAGVRGQDVGEFISKSSCWLCGPGDAVVGVLVR